MGSPAGDVFVARFEIPSSYGRYNIQAVDFLFDSEAIYSVVFFQDLNNIFVEIPNQQVKFTNPEWNRVNTSNNSKLTNLSGDIYAGLIYRQDNNPLLGLDKTSSKGYSYIYDSNAVRWDNLRIEWYIRLLITSTSMNVKPMNSIAQLGPNPFKNFVQLTGWHAPVNVFSLSGRHVGTINGNQDPNGSLIWQTSLLPAGIYMFTDDHGNSRKAIHISSDD
jgi:hypothetical protein